LLVRTAFASAIKLLSQASSLLIFLMQDRGASKWVGGFLAIGWGQSTKTPYSETSVLNFRNFFVT